MTAKILSLEEARRVRPCRRADGTLPESRSPTPLDRALAAVARCDSQSTFELKTRVFQETFQAAMGRTKPAKPVNSIASLQLARYKSISNPDK
jgi:hypothetical protein